MIYLLELLAVVIFGLIAFNLWRSYASPRRALRGDERPALSPGRQAAYLADTPLKAWVLFLHHVTRPGGRITMIHRAAALGDLLELLGPRTGEIEILPVRPAPGAAAGRVLVRARKGLRRGPVTLYDGLTLHGVAGGPGALDADGVREAVVAGLAQEVGLMLEEEVIGSPEQVDLCMVLGAGWPFHLGGICPYLDRTGTSERVLGRRLLPRGTADVPA